MIGPLDVPLATPLYKNDSSHYRSWKLSSDAKRRDLCCGREVDNFRRRLSEGGEHESRVTYSSTATALS